MGYACGLNSGFDGRDEGVDLLAFVAVCLLLSAASCCAFLWFIHRRDLLSQHCLCGVGCVTSWRHVVGVENAAIGIPSPPLSSLLHTGILPSLLRCWLAVFFCRTRMGDGRKFDVCAREWHSI